MGNNPGEKKPVLGIKISDLFRATMADDCGNEGFIGIAPDGSRYHVVVPVDSQIARGLMFWIRPDDGTPFGGYKGWHYFCCLTYEPLNRHASDHEARLEKAWETGWLIQKWLEGIGLGIRLIEDMKKGGSGFQASIQNVPDGSRISR